MLEQESNCYINHLVKLGFKKTKTRLALVDAITERSGCFSAKDIYQDLPRSMGISFSTVYRNFQAFAECGILHSIGTEGRFVSCAGRDSETDLQHLRHTLYRCFSCSDIEERVETTDQDCFIDKGPLAHVGSAVTEVVGQCRKCSQS